MATTRALILFLGVLLAAVGPDGLAQVETPIASAPALGAGLPPEELLERTIQRLLAAVERERGSLGDPRRRLALVRDHIAAHFDFERVSQIVLGKHWRDATAAQRHRFLHELERMVYGSFAELLVRYEVESLESHSPRGDPDQGRVTIRSTLKVTGRAPVDVRFRFRSAGDAWKLVDVVVEGISLVTTYRAAVDTEIRKVGIEGLIQSLAERNAAFDAEAS